MKIWNWNSLEAFQPLSSDVDWCEPNYHITQYIVEFVNTITNLPLIIFPLVQYFLYQEYAKYCQINLRFLLLTLQLVGIGSTYYHATLSFAGQLVDECGILWSLSWLSAGYWPRHLLPFGIKSRDKLTIGYISLAFCFTLLSIAAPAFNQFALILFGAPFIVTLIVDYYLIRESTPVFRKIFRRFIYGFALAFFVWGLDKAFCPLWRSLYIPYLHGLWHILTAYATAYGVVFSIHDDVESMGFPVEKLQLRYFPAKIGFFGIPYVACTGQNQ